MENSSIPDISQVDLSINAFTKALAYTGIILLKYIIIFYIILIYI